MWMRGGSAVCAVFGWVVWDNTSVVTCDVTCCVGACLSAIAEAPSLGDLEVEKYQKAASAATTSKARVQTQRQCFEGTPNTTL